MAGKKRAWAPDEFAPPQKIKPLRAPRMMPARELRIGEQELLDAMTKLRSLLEQNANDGSVEIALGELRATIAYCRARWKYSAGNVEKAHKATTQRLHEKLGQPHVDGLTPREQEERRQRYLLDRAGLSLRMLRRLESLRQREENR